MFFTAAADQVTIVEITADTAQVNVRTEENLDQARVEIAGPQAAIAGATAELRGGIWTVRLPKASGRPTGRSPRRSGRVVNSILGDVTGGQVIQTGDINGGTVFTGNGDMIWGNSGPVNTGSGTVYNNCRVQGLQPQGQDQEDITITLVIPAGIDVTTRTGSGDIDTYDADIRILDVHTGSGSVLAGRVEDAYIHTGSGSVDVRELEANGAITTGTGRIEVEGGRRVTLESGTGSVRWSATQDATVTARTGTGSIRIRRGDHRVITDLSSGTGSIREN